MTASDQMRAMLDQLMGTSRDGEKPAHNCKFSDSKVCKSFLLECCPHDLLANTRVDMGDCPRIHDIALRADFHAGSKIQDYYYDIDATEHLEKFILDCDRKTELAKKRLKETQEELSDEAAAKINIIHGFGEQIGTKLAKAEEFGADGNVEESLRLMEEVEDLKRKKHLAENDYRNTTPASNYQQQKLRVCEVCSAYLGIHDNDRRLADHFGGRLHVGFIMLRSKLNDLQQRLEERKNKQEAEREERRRTNEVGSLADSDGHSRKRSDSPRSSSRRKSTERKRSRTPDRRRKSRTPDRKRRSRTPDRKRKSRTPDRKKRSKTPDRKRRSRTPERKRKSRTPDRKRGSRTPERKRERRGGSRERRSSRDKERDRKRSRSAERRPRETDSSIKRRRSSRERKSRSTSRSRRSKSKELKSSKSRQSKSRSPHRSSNHRSSSRRSGSRPDARRGGSGDKERSSGAKPEQSVVARASPDTTVDTLPTEVSADTTGGGVVEQDSIDKVSSKQDGGEIEIDSTAAV